MNRRQALSMAGASAALAALAPSRIFAADAAAALKSMTADVVPIGPPSSSRALKGSPGQATGIGALLIEPGASLVYFTGVQWWRSERLRPR
jgi:Xaa-Pro dipeptidase